MLSMDRQRAFGRWFLLAAVVYCLLYVNGVSYMIFDYDEYTDAMMIFEFGSTMAFGAPLMPLVAALPFATSFVSDYANGVCPVMTLRSGRSRYLRSKAIYAALSGGAAVAGGMLLFIILLNVLFGQGMQSPLRMEGASGLAQILDGQGISSVLLYYAARLLMQFMAGALWAMSALTFSAFYPNLPLTLCAPLVFYRIFGWLGQLPIFPEWTNVTWLEDAQVNLPPVQLILAGVLMFGGLSVCAWFIFRWRAGRRLQYA